MQVGQLASTTFYVPEKGLFRIAFVIDVFDHLEAKSKRNQQKERHTDTNDYKIVSLAFAQVRKSSQCKARGA